MAREQQQIGAAFEGWLEDQHALALRLGIIAHIEHNQAKAQYIGGILQHTERGVADYTAVVERSGLTLVLEAKTESTKRLDKKRVAKKQADHLTAVARAGGTALLLAEFSSKVGGRLTYARFACPWLQVPWEMARTAWSTTAELLLPWAVPLDTCYLERFHPRGLRTSTAGMAVRKFARE